MIEVGAEVIRTGAGTAWVRLTGNRGGCGRCDEPGGCHSHHIADMFRTGRVYELDDPFGLSVGERVKIVADDGIPLRAALASYGLGTVLILAGAALGVWLAPSAWVDAAAGVGVVVGAALTVLVLHRRTLSTWRLRIERDDKEVLVVCPR